MMNSQLGLIEVAKDILVCVVAILIFSSATTPPISTVFVFSIGCLSGASGIIAVVAIISLTHAVIVSMVCAFVAQGSLITSMCRLRR